MDYKTTFSFVDETTAREPNAYEVLAEIMRQQDQSLPSGAKTMATLESLERSRAIKIPHSPTRAKAIAYLLDLFTSRFPESVRTIVGFDFRVDEASKRLMVIETVEYTVLLNDKDFENIRDLRDRVSVENLMGLLKKYRFFNLSKLISIAKNREDLIRIIQYEQDKQVFTFKNYSQDKNKQEVEEEFCYHAHNYNSVTDSININNLREIIGRYNELVARRLKNFGILSTHVADYRDAKLDYIFEILINDLSGSLSDKDRLDAKNLRSLRLSLLHAERQMDPLQTLGRDIAAFIHDQKFCGAGDITGSIMNLTGELLEKWTTPDNMAAFKVTVYKNPDGALYYMDNAAFLNMISELHQMILYQPERMARLGFSEKQHALSKMEILYKKAREVLGSEGSKTGLALSGDDAGALKKIVEEYETYLKRSSARPEGETAARPDSGRKRSFFRVIIDFIKSLFGGKKAADGRTDAAAHPAQKAINRETRQFYKKVSGHRGPLLALSDFIEIIPENDDLIDVLIKDMRENNLRIVIPIYNAREVLYPKRSQKLLMADIEYLLAPPETVRSPETIRKYTDSLLGFKIKDEVMPARAIMAVEKYLLTLYRQKRALMLKKEL
ncbi:MAG TPA: hypothetical protein ENN21_08680 [Spirochaetes bacterium]|nr:hypothetical protein [Spirochaetota bacterium]